MNELALFAGIGGGILGGMLSGFTCVAACEINPYCRKVLLQRQRDGVLPKFPIWDDIRTFDGKQFAGQIDIITGGFPCQDISAAGKGAGITGERSGLWKEMARIIGEVRPSFVLAENSHMLIHRGLYTVLADLAAMGYDARWGIVSAENAGAPHQRKRIWILAYANNSRQQGTMRGRYESEMSGSYSSCEISNALCFDGRLVQREKDKAHLRCEQWTTEPGLDRVANGTPNRVDRLKAIGNAQVPAVAYMAYEILRR